MTTSSAPQERTPRVLRASALWVFTASAATVALAAALGDAAAVRGALVGGGMALAFFLFGAVVVTVAARIAPGTAMLVALMTYTLQVAAVGLVFVGLVRGDALGDELDARWIAAALMAGTFAWMAGQIVTTLRTPIPPWEPSGDHPGSSSVSGEEADAA